jgi:hypothetical protein
MVACIEKVKSRVRERYKCVNIPKELWEDLKRIATEKNISIPDVIREMHKIYIGGPATTTIEKRIETEIDCTARRAKKFGKAINAYIVECRSGEKAIVPPDTLGDLSQRFGLRIRIIE